MKFFKLLMLFTVITSNFSYGQCEKRINDYIQMIKSMSCSDANNPNSQAMINLDRVGKELANSCSMLFVQRGEEIKKATIDKVNSCGSNINSNSQSNNQSNNNNSTYNSNSSSNSQNSSSSVGTSSMNRGGNIVTGNSNSQNSNNQEEEIARHQQEKTNQEVEKANQQLAEINKRKEDEIRIAEQTNQELYNKNLENATNVINSSVTNAINKSQINRKNNNQEIKDTQEEFSNYDLSDSEIDSLLNNSTPDKYTTIHLYNLFKGRGIGLKFFTFINGYKAPALIKNQKIEHRIYLGNKLTIQFYASGFGGTSDLTTYNTRIRKGKTYYFVIRREGNFPIIEEVETPPTDEKIENLSLKVKSDLEN